MPPSMKPDYRTLPVKLTETERMARAMTAAELQSTYCTVEERKKDTARELGQELKELRKKIETAQAAVRTGEEPQKVQIEHKRNEDRRTVETIRLDTGEIIDSRPMTVEERQGKLALIAGGRAAAAKDDDKAAKAEKAKRDAAKTTAAPSKARNGAKKDSGRPKTRRSTSASKDPNSAS